MADLRTLTLEKLRAMARRLLGPGHAKLRTKAALVAALAEAGKKPTRAPKGVAAATFARRGKKAAAREERTPARTGGPSGAEGRPAAKQKTPAGKKPARGRLRTGAAAGLPEPSEPPRPAPEVGGLDPAAFFVARVRGEEAVRGAPHFAEVPAKLHEEPLGDLPASYGEDALVVLPRDPRTLFVYWDHAQATLREAFRDLDGPRVELWLWARDGDGWELARKLELALESRGYYVHGVDAGRTYRAELRVLDRAGRERLLGPGSGDAGLPPGGPSRVVDDRLVRIPWDQPLGGPVGPGHRGLDFPAEAREELAQRSAPGAADAWSGGLPRPSSPGGPRSNAGEP